MGSCNLELPDTKSYNNTSICVTRLQVNLNVIFGILMTCFSLKKLTKKKKIFKHILENYTNFLPEPDNMK